MSTLETTGSSQRGVATVFITVVLLLAVGLITLYTSRSAIFEQRLSANEVRAKQALGAANAGLDHALAHMRKGGIYQDDNDPNDGAYFIDVLTANAAQLQNGAGTISRYRVAYVNAAAAIPDCPATSAAAIPGVAASAPARWPEVMAVSCGWSDDDSSVQRVLQLLEHSPSLAGAVSTPLISRGGVNVTTGNASVFNFFNDLTVWSGGAVTSKSAPGKTYVRDVVGHPDPAVSVTNSPLNAPIFRNHGQGNNVPSHYEPSTHGTTLGHDMVMGDTNLSDLSPAAFFQYFMGAPLDTYRDSIATYRVDLNNALTNEDSTNVNSINNMQDKVIWVEGDMTLPSLGTREKPVILVVKGNLTVSNNAVVNGLVFVTGDVDGNGNPTIFGGLVSSGQFKANGGLAIVYDPNVLGAASNLGPAAKVPGTWRDW